MPIDPVNPLGWGQKDPVTSGQMNGLDQRLVRAVDGVQGGAYSGPVNLTASSLTGTSTVDTTGIVRTKTLVQAGFLALGSTSVGGLVDGATVAINGLGTSIVYLTSNVVGGKPNIFLEFSILFTNALYLVSLNHTSMIIGQIQLTWSGTGITHRFSGGANVDGQPTPGSGIDLWTGLAVSPSEVWWSLKRGLQ